MHVYMMSDSVMKLCFSAVTDIISLEKSLDGLMLWARKYHGYLVSDNSTIPKSQREIEV